MGYARWLSKKTGKTYRLPTEAEWEYACRAGTQTAYSFGDSPKELGNYAWLAGNAKKQPNPVAKKKPNAFGLFDMHGNVSEWVVDQYDPGVYAKATAGAFPVLIPSNRRYPHVARGGSWTDKETALRCAARRPSNKDWSRQDPQNPQSIWWHTEATDVGFRIVRIADDYPELRNLKSKIVEESPY
jgi:formylglycine-generating enzyme required for sulfatase activity